MPRLPRRFARWLAAIVAALAALGGYAAVDGPNPLDALLAASGFSEATDTRSPEQANNGIAQLGEADLSWSANDYPDYYRVLGTAQDVDEGANPGIAYGDLDALGRATWAGGWITGEMRAAVRAQDRNGAPDPADPVGWPRINPEVSIEGIDGRRTYHGRLWNRSHLVAWSLGGSMEAANIVPGTRTQNIGDNVSPGGMGYAEDLARTWLDQNPQGMLWYAATPIYQGDETIPRAVVVDIRTDDGSIDERVLVYNTANGWDIDYATGDVQAA